MRGKHILFVSPSGSVPKWMRVIIMSSMHLCNHPGTGSPILSIYATHVLLESKEMPFNMAIARPDTNQCNGQMGKRRSIRLNIN